MIIGRRAKESTARALLLACVALASTLTPDLAYPAPRSDGDASCGPTLVSSLPDPKATRLVLAKMIRQGEPLSLKSPPDAGVETATGDVCLLKLVVGPGVPGPADAPSTSAGISIEVWLPAPSVWTGRVLALHAGGWSGDPKVGRPDELARDLQTPDYHAVSEFALVGRYLTVISDGGHQRANADGMMLPDGSINHVGWADLSHRAAHVLAITSKALAKAYYDRPPHHSYLYGFSSGGRAAYNSAQLHPGDYDGILARAPAIGHTQIYTHLAYGPLLIQRELGGKAPDKARLDFVSHAAVRACDSTITGQHDGYITDYESCGYDPTQDSAVLCANSGGTASRDLCVTLAEARVINRLWYGPTRDGSVPAPTADNGTTAVRGSDHLWWGAVRGTILDTVAAAPERSVGIRLSQYALNLENPSLAPPGFVNDASVGRGGWKSMTYGQLAAAMDQGRALNRQFAYIDSDNPNIREFAARGHKLLTYHGIADENVPPEASVNYFVRVASLFGGNKAAQEFHRVFLVPGLGHNVLYGTARGAPAPMVTVYQMLDALVAWVEGRQPPRTIIATTPDQKLSRPICMYPERPSFLGGDPALAASFKCELR